VRFTVAMVGLAVLLLWGCRGQEEAASRQLVVFHAGSLAIPFRDIAAEFERRHPGVKVIREASGSRAAARKIADLKRPCDVMVSADYSVIDELLIPAHADWNLPFATNAMVLAYAGDLPLEQVPQADTWTDLLSRPGARVGHSDPDSDPCGYRALMVLQLAALERQSDTLANAVSANALAHIRPKASDLIALLELGELDYAFLYKSVAVQHGLPFLELPASVNLADPAHASRYARTRVRVSGASPGTFIEKTGTVMAYSATVLRDAPERELALAFVEFLVSDQGGLSILQRHGQPALVPASTPSFEHLPPRLRSYARP
jgi:molybdate/tungstate transport system substrate-binding protein